jgi:NDP-sugar pyrophosphorylase family protein
MQMVILAGGLATRLGELSRQTPKSMILIQGKPFLEYQIGLLKSQGITELLLCVGHLGEKIEAYFRDGKSFGLNIRYSWESSPLGMGGALVNAEPLLEEEFMLLYGDSYLPLDYQQVIRVFQQQNTLGTMVIFKNHNKYDKSNIVLNGLRIMIYDKRATNPMMHHIDAGLSVYKKKALAALPAGPNVPLDNMIQHLIRERELSAHETDQRFYEIGSLQGIQDFQDYLRIQHPEGPGQ